ncbi:protein-S-isoprenylcysteine O-methyltransferase [Venturia canescens]|uniref:protein-S-isoprenylcysteine O-methyltransferase n=1 Tax=Venturia canescens TaxID=32260 RepID=UPI001C9D3851|nr:protein-S-isoprenylcysteine O-methyltransferase [Venturia canescens]
MSLCKDGKVSVFCYITALVVSSLPQILLLCGFDPFSNGIFHNVWILHVFQFIVLNILILFPFRGFTYQVAIRSTFLGYVFGAGILVLLLAPASWQCFGIYMAVMATFHYSEFLSIAWTNPSAISIDSFILQHSVPYVVAACVSWIEFLVEHHFYPSLKELSIISYIGLAICVSGEALRKIAMFTAKQNFNHIIQTEKSTDHKLITHGVYRFCRHPSYVGWFYWSIGTQLILKNPICLLAYAVASWSFFHDRILIEEITLLTFFGEAYVEYQKKVGTGLPFISGYRISL